MKKKILKTAALLVAVGLIGFLAYFANGLVGNPVSKALSKRTAEKYVAEKYADTDFFIEDICYDFKTCGYYARIKSPSSIDSHFSLRFNMDGKLSHDSYEQDVKSGWNTAQRLDTEYRKLADAVFESPSFPFKSDICFGTLETVDRDYIENEDIPDFALVTEELETDKLYDIRELGREAGELIVYIDDETVSIERAAEVMLKLKEIMDESGVTFRAMDFVLQHPKPEKGVRSDEAVRTENFLYEDIYEEGMTERVKKADEELREYYEKIDKENEKLQSPSD